MPIALPQLSRREFLKRAALAGAGAVLTPGCASLAGKSGDKNTFAFFSDPHIAADAATVSRNVNMADNLVACVRELAAWPVNPAAVIVNGDLAFQLGKPEDYATFGKLFEPVRALAPVHLTLGNHDERNNFWKAFPHDAAKLKSVPQKQAAIFSSDRANWFLLDSLDKTDATPGELGAAQLAWLDRGLNGLRRRNPRSLWRITICGTARLCHWPDGFGGVGGIVRPAPAGQGVHLRPHARLARSASTQAACISSICRRRATCFTKAGPAAGCAPRSRATAWKSNCVRSTRNIPNTRR